MINSKLLLLMMFIIISLYLILITSAEKCVLGKKLDGSCDEKAYYKFKK